MIVTSSSSRGLFVLLICCFGCEAQPKPAYSPSILMAEPFRTANAAIVDFDGDGHQDVLLAIGRHWPGQNLVLFGDGQGQFPRVEALSRSPERTYSTAVADMDGDGDPDLVVSNDRPDANYLWINDGQGRLDDRIDFGDPSWPTRNASVADVNDDGALDVLVANRDNRPEGNNAICLNRLQVGEGLDCQPLESGSTTTITPADMDGDGDVDLIIPYRDNGQSFVYQNNGAGQFDTRIPFGPPDASFRAAATLDLNDDGMMDLVAIDDRKAVTLMFLQEEDGSYAIGERIDEGGSVPYALAHADLDGNGRHDVLVGYRQAPDQIFFNDAAGWSSIAIGDSLGATYGFAVGDLNGDAILDIVAARSDAADLVFFGVH